MLSRLAFLIIFAASFLTLPGCRTTAPVVPDFEVWTADQNLNRLYFLNRDGAVLRTLDGAALGNAQRPHMLWGVPGDGYVYSANTVSGSVTVLDRDGGNVVEVIRDVGKLPHAAQPNPARPDNIYVFNIGPQAAEEGTPDRGETIAEIVRTGGPSGASWEVRRFLDLKAQSTLGDDSRFPTRRPVCGGFSPSGDRLLVTLFDGGLAVVDLEEWTVSRSWGNDQIARHGCGFASSLDGNDMYVTAGDMHSSWLYVFDMTGAEPELVASHDLSAAGQDAHGVYVDPRRNELWIVHRVSDNITIHPVASIREPGHSFETIASVGKAPDLVAFSPDSDRAYVTLRGPNPAPTIPHSTVGETPGITIIDVARRQVLEIVPLGDRNDSDFHGIFVPRANRR